MLLIGAVIVHVHAAVQVQLVVGVGSGWAAPLYFRMLWCYRNCIIIIIIIM